MKVKDERQIEKIKNGLRIKREIVEEWHDKEDVMKLVTQIEDSITKLKAQKDNLQKQIKEMKKAIPEIEKAIKEYEKDLEKVKRLYPVEVKKINLKKEVEEKW